MAEEKINNSDNLYESAVEYVENITRFAPKTKLENTKILLNALGNPEKKAKVVHVAGTNGKGSVSKMVSLMLEEAGFKTGLFISPHLIRMNERISVNGVDISNKDFVKAFNKVMSTTKNLLSGKTIEENGFQHPAYFEFLFAMAATYFAEQECDFVVYETGLGGRLDATNVTAPEVSVITSIGLDHMQYLGDTVEKIAAEKAGIIKSGIPVVFNTGSDVADTVIIDKCNELKCQSVDVRRIKKSDILSNDFILKNCQKYSVSIQEIIDEGFLESVLPARSPLYQIDNATTASLTFISLGLDLSDIKGIIGRALCRFRWDGRMQFLSDNIVIDGAHNENAAMKAVESVKEICRRDNLNKVSILFAVSSDKDYDSIIRILTEGLDIEDVYVSEINSDRKCDISEVMKIFQKYLPKEKHFDVCGTKNLKEAFKLAKGELLSDNLLLIIGSLYMVGDILGMVYSESK